MKSWLGISSVIRIFGQAPNNTKVQVKLIFILFICDAVSINMLLYVCKGSRKKEVLKNEWPGH